LSPPFLVVFGLKMHARRLSYTLPDCLNQLVYSTAESNLRFMEGSSTESN